MSLLTAPAPAATVPPPLAPAISAWPDVDDLYRRFDALVRQPMRPIRPDGMARVMRYFDERCAGSRRRHTAAGVSCRDVYAAPGGGERGQPGRRRLGVARGDGGWPTFGSAG